MMKYQRISHSFSFAKIMNKKTKVKHFKVFLNNVKKIYSTDLHSFFINPTAPSTKKRTAQPLGVRGDISDCNYGIECIFFLKIVLQHRRQGFIGHD